MTLAYLTILTILQPATVLGLTPRASILSVSKTDWDSFNTSISGRLHNGIPMLEPCYDNYNGKPKFPDLTTCASLMVNRGDMAFVTDQFGGYTTALWGGCPATGDTCTLGALNANPITPITKQCRQGTVPWKYVDAREVSDVQRALQFAEKNRLRLVIKNTGHDFQGRSAAPDSLGLWTHNMQPPIALNTAFTAAGCSKSNGDAITFGAGQQFQGIYDFVEAHGYRVVGGDCVTVGAAGGWITGGGHGILTNELGLGVDNVQQLKAVLPNGTYITTSRCQNQDLFFALRGGGGGTFAVITEMTTLVHPKRPIQRVDMTFATLTPVAVSKFLSILVGNGEKWASEGWGGIINSLAVGVSVSIGTAMLSYGEAVESMKPLAAFATTFNVGTVNITTTDSNQEAQGDVSLGPPATASSWVVASRLVPRKAFANAESQKQLVSLLQGILAVKQEGVDPSLHILSICLNLPTVYSQHMPQSEKPGGSAAASITPAWRDGIWQVGLMRPFDGSFTDPELVQRISQSTHEALNPLRAFTPDSGAYINEADTFEPDYTTSFWGRENYERLLRIKKEVDPTNLLMVHNGVGWEEADGRFSCYVDVSS